MSGCNHCNHRPCLAEVNAEVLKTYRNEFIEIDGMDWLEIYDNLKDVARELVSNGLGRNGVDASDNPVPHCCEKVCLELVQEALVIDRRTFSCNSDSQESSESDCDSTDEDDWESGYLETVNIC